MLTLDQRAEISELLEDGLSFREVARRAGVAFETVRRFARQIDDEANAYLPTPEEIEAECQKIRARWSEEEKESRRFKESRRSVRFDDPQAQQALADAGIEDAEEIDDGEIYYQQDDGQSFVDWQWLKSATRSEI